MAKVKTVVKIQVTAGALEPAKIGQALGPHGLNIQQFMVQVNEVTKDKAGQVIPVEITVFEDRTFSIKFKTPPAAYLLRKAAGIEKGSGVPHKNKVGSVTKDQVREIARLKLEDLNTKDLDQAMKIIEGTARQMGIEIAG